jgi:hypothetical protein
MLEYEISLILITCIARHVLTTKRGEGYSYEGKTSFGVVCSDRQKAAH